MLKKISIVFVTLILIFTLTGCNGNTEQKSDSDILYEIKGLLDIEIVNITEDITIPTVDNEDVNVTWTSSKPEYLDIDGTVTRPEYNVGDQSVSLTVVLELNDALVTKSFNFTVLSLEKPDNIELNTDYTDALAMDFIYDDSNFITDGIGEVTLTRCIDGDTAVFTEGSTSFTVRFLGIDTPESTYKFDPWGKAASHFTCEKLENATTIVLEWDSGAETRTDGNGRYLSWVWYDGRLLNLELVEEALTGSKGVGGLKYENIFYQAEFKTQDTDRRIWGEIDPDFDYSLDGIQITIEELVTHPELYVGVKVVIRGVVSRTIGQHPYIQDGNYGIYLFSGFTFTTKLSQGNEVLISGLVPTYYPNSETGGLQLTGFVREDAEVLSEGNVVVPVDKLITEITTQDVGSLLKIYNLTVTNINENSYDDTFTMTVEDENGNVITVRRDDLVSDDISVDLFEIGTTFDIVAPLGRYDSNFQLMVVHLDDVTFK